MHRVVSREQWIAERQKLLAEEKAFTRQRDALGEKRRALPWVKVDKTYEFDSAQGRVTLADLFRGKSQLFVQHVMQGPNQPLQCVGCALGVDHLESILPHLENHDVSVVAIARATLPELTALRERMGWRIPFYSAFGSDFNYDYGVSFKPEDLAAGRAYYNYGYCDPGIEDISGNSVFHKDESGTIFHTYSNYSRGGEDFLGIYRILEVTPKGRNEHGPHFSLTDWARPHTMYGKGGEVAPNGRYTPSRLLLHVRCAVEAASRREFLAVGAAVAAPVAALAAAAQGDSPRAGLLAGKNAVIYGAAGAIGSAVSRAFAREGAQVFLAGRTPERVKALAQELIQTGASAIPAGVDALDRDSVERHLGEVMRQAGHVDISFNLIGLGGEQGAMLTKMTREAFAVCIDNAIRTHFLTATAAARHMEPRGSGVILALTAQVARKPYVGSGGFGVACAAIEGLCRQLAIELGPRGIRVVALRSSGSPDSPGVVAAVAEHARAAGVTREAFEARIAEKTMLKRMPKMAEIANAAVLMASDRASSVTAAVLNATCGEIAD